jgi:hypothetical protein
MIYNLDDYWLYEYDITNTFSEKPIRHYNIAFWYSR